jgi:hypothetical protein
LGILFLPSLEDVNVEIGGTFQEDSFSTANGILTAGPLEQKFQIIQVEIKWKNILNTQTQAHNSISLT